MLLLRLTSIHTLFWLLDIFPLDKIYHLWDKILVGPSSLSLFVGIAILQQFRQELLRSEFNEAIGIFSESFPEMDIEKCIEAALAMCRVTPPSTCWLSYDQETREMRKQLSVGRAVVSNGGSSGNANATNGDVSTGAGAGAGADAEATQKSGRTAAGQQQESRRLKEAGLEKRLSNGNGAGLMYWWEEPLTIETMNAELAPRIHRSDFVRLRQQAMVLDIRAEPESVIYSLFSLLYRVDIHIHTHTDTHAYFLSSSFFVTSFRNGHYPLSIQMSAGQLDYLVLILEKLKKNYLVVIANRGDSGPEVSVCVFCRRRVRYTYNEYYQEISPNKSCPLTLHIVCVGTCSKGLPESCAVDGRY